MLEKWLFAVYQNGLLSLKTENEVTKKKIYFLDVTHMQWLLVSSRFGEVESVIGLQFP